MDPAKIDWKTIDSRFVEDVFYEHFRAPKWFDFLDPNGPNSVDDEAWFCRPDCSHPKTAEDFLRRSPASKSAIDGNEIPQLRDRRQRDGKLRRRELAFVPSTSNEDLTRYNDDGENHNPNISTPQNQRARSWKAVPKPSGSVSSKLQEERLQNEETPKLKSASSARNLFAGRDILGHIADFCHELKKLTTRAREREIEDKSHERTISLSCQGEKEEQCSSNTILHVENRMEKERKPLLQAARVAEKRRSREKQTKKKRVEDAEESIQMLLDTGNLIQKGPDSSLQIRTHPPSPQCFSTTRAPATVTPSKVPRSRLLMDRGILQEAGTAKANESKNVSVVDAREQRNLDVFWFLKPCALSS